MTLGRRDARAQHGVPAARNHHEFVGRGMARAVRAGLSAMSAMSPKPAVTAQKHPEPTGKSRSAPKGAGGS
ncbi:hypothetical protein BL253_02160 [Pseudofrankia asymbiotica]|uniref:Uncharacterized protein n=1 Tax=Pseudofrankia asymbiotica TaxID=1834516 RepID=A0A1V2IJN0_9ACTN|nr:hypothetical protein BL253_02160 [Pseudofrankia asymbiotica]